MIAVRSYQIKLTELININFDNGQAALQSRSKS